MHKKNIFLLIVLTIIFSLIIFYLKMYFFSGIEKSIEEEYIDRSLYFSLNSSKKTESDKSKSIINENKILTGSIIKEKTKKNVINYKFTYIPRDFENDSILQTNIIKKIVISSPFKEIILNLGIDLYKDVFDVRGKMKNGKVKLFGVKEIKTPELVTVFIHELGHFIDIYNLNDDNKEEKDPSQYFYDIAWNSTKTIKSSLRSYDFVSGYSMTNKYEDFAETFTYYVLHNEDFAEKAINSEILRKKYDFFHKYLFKNDEFVSVNFGNDEEIKDYYWDITKIDINLEIFLQYFKNPI